MIRVDPIPPTPAVLIGDESAAAKERNEAAEHWKTHGTMKGFKFKVYKEREVVAALEDTFNGKCAYCEGRYDNNAPCEVEHYRPKGGVEVDGKLGQPGYYWLAADWMNLLPSCGDCNKMRYHEFADDEPEARGKANKFPIADPAKRAKAPGEEAFEECLLLHPYIDEPRDFLTFVEDGKHKGVIQALPGPDGQPREKARVSIRVYGLDRPRLTSAREDVWIRVAGNVKVAKRHLATVNANPDDPAAQINLNDAIASLKHELSARASFLAMARQLAEPLRDLVT